MSIARKFTIWITVIILGVGAFSSYLYYRYHMIEEIERLKSLGRTAGPLVEESLINYMLTKDITLMERTLDSLKGIDPITSIRLFNREGVIKGSTEKGEINTKFSHADPFCRGCHEKRKMESFVKQGEILRWVQPVKNRPECHKCHNPEIRYNGIIIIDFSLYELEKHVNNDILKGLLILGLSLITIGLVMLLMSKTLITKRLRGVIDGVRRFEKGAYNITIPVKGKDEITELEKTFNEMAEAINARDREKDSLLQEISRSHEQWQNTFDSITNLISINDRDCNILRANAAFMEYFGLTQEELLHKKCYELIYGTDSLPEDSPHRITLNENCPATGEVVNRKINRIFRVTTYPYESPETELYSFIVEAQDITEEKEKEKKLRESNERRQLILENIDEVVYMVSTKGDLIKGTVEFVSSQSERIIGCQPEEFLHDPELWLRLIHPEDAPGVFESSRSIFRDRAMGIRQYRIRHKNTGEYRWMEDKVVPQMDEKGNVVGFFGVARDITERRKTEIIIMKERDFSRGLISSLPGIFYLFNDKEKMIQWNENLEEVTGYSAEEIQNLKPLDFVAERDKEIVSERILEAFVEGRSRAEANFLSKSGKEIPYLLTGVRGKADNESYIVGVGIDITDLKKTEEEIRRNYLTQFVIASLLRISLENISLEEILQLALNLILSIQWLSFESKGSIFLVEDDPDTLVMKAQKGLSVYIQRECAIVMSGKCLCGQAALTKEVQFSDTLDERHEIRHEGIAPHGHYCVPILFSGETYGVINTYLREGHQRDKKEEEFLKVVANVLAGIIQRKRMEREREKLMLELQVTLGRVSRSQKEWQETFDSITDLVSIHDKDSNIIKANKAFAEYFGFSNPREVINKKCNELFHAIGIVPYNCPHKISMRDGKAVTSEVTNSERRKILQVTAFPYYSPEGDILGSVHIARDITEEKEKEMRLIMSERLAALGQLASGIAHEINNPLASIAGCTEGLLLRIRKGQIDPDFFVTYLKIIEEEILRCKGITTGMLSFVRKTTYEKMDININELLDKTLEIIGYQGRFLNVEIIKNYALEMPHIYGNKGELRQAFMIIIGNALDAMDDRGRLILETGIEGDSEFVKISDTGPGIPLENINRIFDLFFTTKPEKGGTGLGLSIAQKIIANHNGNIDVVSEEGKGTAFKITLPIGV